LHPKRSEDKPLDRLKYERTLRTKGARHIAGIDEAGRGALAGPVAAAAVVLPPDTFIERVDDSKKLSPELREELFPIIMETAVAVGIGIAAREVIDRFNIRRATQMAMTAAVLDLPLTPDALLIDAMYLPKLQIHQESIIKGDNLSHTIAAASIIAKVARDNIMRYYHESYPDYRFDQHKGYATRNHLESIKVHGPCVLHRKTFRGVKEHLSPDEKGARQRALTFSRER